MTRSPRVAGYCRVSTLDQHADIRSRRSAGLLASGANGESITSDRMTQLVRQHVFAAKIPKTGTCHL